MVGTIERVLQDVLVDRDILSNSLNNYMSLVAHKTNQVMSKLTVVSIIFLPLTFLCGVYGMNFDIIPELKWAHGYGYFWGAAGIIVLGLLLLMKRYKVLEVATPSWRRGPPVSLKRVPSWHAMASGATGLRGVTRCGLITRR